MRRIKPTVTRNKMDVADPIQIRILKKRLGVSSDDLTSRRRQGRQFLRRGHQGN
jgi:hypothetical protein